jgi:hypothetical protein
MTAVIVRPDVVNVYSRGKFWGLAEINDIYPQIWVIRQPVNVAFEVTERNRVAMKKAGHIKAAGSVSAGCANQS